MNADPTVSPQTGCMADLTIANTVSDLILGDIQEHLPLERIPLDGDVLGLGTTTSVDNGELTFLHDDTRGSAIWRCVASDGSVVKLDRGDAGSHFPYVCFTRDATDLRRPVPLERLGAVDGARLQDLVATAIDTGRRQGLLEPAPVYGVRLLAHWHELVITVASKLCMGQQRRNAGVASSADGETTASLSIYDMLQHYRLAPLPQEDPNDPIRYLGRSMQWDCCGFFDTEPELGRVTVPQPGAHLHIHGCSTDLAYGGHLHHEHAATRLQSIDRLVLYPLETTAMLGSDMAVDGLGYSDGTIRFRILNCGEMDVSNVGVAVVLNDSYASHRYVRIPWMNAGGSESFTMAWDLPAGRHQFAVLVDPEKAVIESEDRRANNVCRLDVLVS